LPAAIVNNPDIILADEPTGALDTETSIQVIDILKEIARDRLVIMVTHNPDLAERYSTRIVRMLDGRIISDSMPLSEEEARLETAKAQSREEINRKKKKPSMSFGTSFGLSLKNLFTKKGMNGINQLCRFHRHHRNCADLCGIPGHDHIYQQCPGGNPFLLSPNH
jgi:putative ABC transport system permease protein